MNVQASIDTFRINGTRMLIQEPYEYLDQIHAVSTMLGMLASDASPNSEIIAGCGRAIATLTCLAALTLEAMDPKSEQNGGAA